MVERARGSCAHSMGTSASPARRRAGPRLGCSGTLVPALTRAPVAGRPGTRGSRLMLPPPFARLILAARRNRVEKNLCVSVCVCVQGGAVGRRGGQRRTGRRLRPAPATTAAAHAGRALVPSMHACGRAAVVRRPRPHAAPCGRSPSPLRRRAADEHALVVNQLLLAARRQLHVAALRLHARGKRRACGRMRACAGTCGLQASA